MMLRPYSAPGQLSTSAVRNIAHDQLLQKYLQHSYLNIAKNLDSAGLYGDKALRLALRKQNMPAASLAYALLARINFNTSGYLKALEYLDMASLINSKTDIPELDAYIKYVTAVHFMMVGKKKEAINETTKSISIYEQLKDSTGMASLYKFIGILYLQSSIPGDPVKAKFYFLKTLDIYNRQADYSRSGNVCASISDVFLRQKNYDSASHYMRKAIWYDSKYHNRIWLAADYMGLAEIKSALSQYDSADYYILMAGDYFTHPNDLALFFIARGKILQKRNQYSAAHDLFYKAYKLAGENQISTALEAIARIVETAEMVNDDKTALIYLKEYTRLKDTLCKTESMPATSLLEIQREHDLKTRQMKVGNEKVLFESQRKSFYLLVLAIFSILLILLSLVVFYYLKLRQRAILLEKTALNNSIEFKNKEMTMAVMSMLKKNEILSGIRQQLLEIEKGDIHADARAAINHIAWEIKEMSGAEIWEEFELRFKQVHTDFDKNLIHMYPDLSAGDMRLCALLRLNLSTKEIAQLTGQSTNAIEVARSRLRKKLGITDPEINLVAFLSKI